MEGVRYHTSTMMLLKDIYGRSADNNVEFGLGTLRGARTGAAHFAFQVSELKLKGKQEANDETDGQTTISLPCIDAVIRLLYAS